MKRRLKQLKEVKLPTDEKQELRSEFVAFMQDHPSETSHVTQSGVLRDERVSDPIRRIDQNMFKFTNLFKPLISKTMLATILLSAILAGTGSTALAAESSLPGDTLYPVKSFNESVVSAAQFSDEAKAEWQNRLAERRLEEGARLALKGELTDERRAEIEAKFEEHKARAEEKIAELIAEGETEKANQIQERLNRAEENEGRLPHFFNKGKHKPNHDKLEEFGELSAEEQQEKVQEFLEKKDVDSASAATEAIERLSHGLEKVAERLADYREEGDASIADQAAGLVGSAQSSRDEAQSQLDADQPIDAIISTKDGALQLHEASKLIRPERPERKQKHRGPQQPS